MHWCKHHRLVCAAIPSVVAAPLGVGVEARMPFFALQALSNAAIPSVVPESIQPSMITSLSPLYPCSLASALPPPRLTRFSITPFSLRIAQSLTC